MKLTTRNKELEKISDDIRMGVPVSGENAIKAIIYQNREKNMFDRILDWWEYS